MRGKKVSVIVPVYNEEAVLEAFFEELTKVINRLSDFKWELVFVDDGSQDRSWEIIKRIVENGKGMDIKALSFSRNFGKEIALAAGMDHASGDAVICIDADLQHPPDLIPQMLERWQAGYKVIVAIRRDVENFPWYRKVGSVVFYWLMNRYSSVKLVPGATDYCLLDRQVVEVLKSFKEKTRLFKGLVNWVGFEKALVYFKAPARNRGSSTFNLKLLFDLAINSFTSFSLLPLRFTGYLGVFIVFSSFLLFLFMLATKFFWGWKYTPLAFVTIINTFLIGIVLCALGFIALYIGHIHTEVVGRPLYIVKESLQSDSSS